jgi:hypothetical protein
MTALDLESADPRVEAQLDAEFFEACPNSGEHGADFVRTEMRPCLLESGTFRAKGHQAMKDVAQLAVSASRIDLAVRESSCASLPVDDI